MNRKIVIYADACLNEKEGAGIGIIVFVDNKLKFKESRRCKIRKSTDILALEQMAVDRAYELALYVNRSETEVLIINDNVGTKLSGNCESEKIYLNHICYIKSEHHNINFRLADELSRMARKTNYREKIIKKRDMTTLLETIKYEEQEINFIKINSESGGLKVKELENELGNTLINFCDIITESGEDEKEDMMPTPLLDEYLSDAKYIDNLKEEPPSIEIEEYALGDIEVSNNIISNIESIGRLEKWLDNDNSEYTIINVYTEILLRKAFSKPDDSTEIIEFFKEEIIRYKWNNMEEHLNQMECLVKTIFHDLYMNEMKEVPVSLLLFLSFAEGIFFLNKGYKLVAI